MLLVGTKQVTHTAAQATKLLQKVYEWQERLQDSEESISIQGPIRTSPPDC